MSFAITNQFHKAELMKLCRDFSISETFTDVRLIAKGGRKVYAHKLVLGSVSPLLATLLSSRHDQLESTTIHLPDISYITLRLVVNFVYMGTMRLNSSDKADFIEALNLLQIDLQLANDPEPAKPSVVNHVPPPQSNDSTVATNGPYVVSTFSQNPEAVMRKRMSNSSTAVANNNNNNSPSKNVSTNTVAPSTSTQSANGLTQFGNTLTQSVNGATVAQSVNGATLAQSVNGATLAQSVNGATLAQSVNGAALAQSVNGVALSPNKTFVAQAGNQQLLQVVPITALDLQQLTSATNLTGVMGGGGLVALANLTPGGQVQPDGSMQLFACNANNAAQSGLTLLTAAPCTASAAPPPTAPAGAVIDLSDDDDPPPSAAAPATSPAAATASSPAVAASVTPTRRKRQATADPDAVAMLAKRLLDASGQSQENGVIDLDND